MNLLTCFALLDVGTIGGSQIKVSNGASAVTSLNDIIKSVGTVIGAIIILVAIIKLIMSYVTESASDRSNGSLMFGVGVFFISISQILTQLAITKDIKTVDMARNVITVICSFLTYGGIALALMAVINLIMALVEESPQAKVSGSKQLGGAVGLLSVSSLGTAIKIRLGTTVASSGKNTASYINDAFGYIAIVCTYIGAGLAVMGVWTLASSFSDESGAERSKANKLLIGAIAMISMRFIIKTVFNVEATIKF